MGYFRMRDPGRRRSTKSWDESKHPRQNNGKFGESDEAIANSEDPNHPDYQPTMGDMHYDPTSPHYQPNHPLSVQVRQQAASRAQFDRELTDHSHSMAANSDRRMEQIRNGELQPRSPKSIARDINDTARSMRTYRNVSTEDTNAGTRLRNLQRVMDNLQLEHAHTTGLRIVR